MSVLVVTGNYAWLWTEMLDRSFLMISLTAKEKRETDGQHVSIPFFLLHSRQHIQYRIQWKSNIISHKVPIVQIVTSLLASAFPPHFYEFFDSSDLGHSYREYAPIYFFSHFLSETHCMYDI